MCYRPVYLRALDMFVPCGKCLECSQSVSTEWALRICLEASLYERNCCLTLTYDNEHLPPKGLLEQRDCQLFLKSLRKAIYPAKVRYFLSGEYGEKRGRPHYHVILFGFCPDDLVFHHRKEGRDFFTSETISGIWRRGHVLVGMVDWHTAFYTAKYLQKLVHSDKAVKPFVRMSTHPGIGIDAFKPEWLRTDKCYLNGRTYRIPRYFYKVLEREGVVLNNIRAKHFAKARALTYNVRTADLEARENKARDFLGLPRLLYCNPCEFSYDYIGYCEQKAREIPADFKDLSCFGREWWYNAFDDIEYDNYTYFEMPKPEQLTYL